MAKKRISGPKARGNKAGKPGPPEDDAALWRAFTQNIDPAELKPRVPSASSEMLDDMLRSERARTSRQQPAGAPLPAAPKPAKDNNAKPVIRTPPATAGQIDAQQTRRIRSGRDGIDARIDLHGMRQSEAHSALRVFLHRSVAKGHRIVLVITGKGGPGRAAGGDDAFGPFVNEGAPDRGVLRRNAPLWLNEPDLRTIVVGHTPAHVRHGGDGAFYVQLRRKRRA